MVPHNFSCSNALNVVVPELVGDTESELLCRILKKSLCFYGNSIVFLRIYRAIFLMLILNIFFDQYTSKKLYLLLA